MADLCEEYLQNGQTTKIAGAHTQCTALQRKMSILWLGYLVVFKIFAQEMTIYIGEDRNRLPVLTQGQAVQSQ